MAVSPLEQININDLESMEYCTGQRLLLSAMSERNAVSRVRGNGTFGTYTIHTYFKWSTITSRYGNAGEPFIPMSKTTINTMLKDSFNRYIRNNNLDTPIFVGDRLVFWTEAEILAEYELDELPEFSIPNKDSYTSVYKIITECEKYVSADIRFLGYPLNPSWLDIKWEGTFEDSTLYWAQWSDHIKCLKFYDLNSTAYQSDYGIFPLPNVQFRNSCTYTNQPQDDTGRFATFMYQWFGSDFRISMHYIRTSVIKDFTLIETVGKIMGMPIESRYFDQYNLFTDPYLGFSTQDPIEPSGTTHTKVGKVLTNILGQEDIADPLTLPDYPTEEAFSLSRTSLLGGGNGVGRDRYISGLLDNKLIHNWDGEGGFEYYTP